MFLNMVFMAKNSIVAHATISLVLANTIQNNFLKTNFKTEDAVRYLSPANWRTQVVQWKEVKTQQIQNFRHIWKYKIQLPAKVTK